MNCHWLRESVKDDARTTCTAFASLLYQTSCGRHLPGCRAHRRAGSSTTESQTGRYWDIKAIADQLHVNPSLEVANVRILSPDPRLLDGELLAVASTNDLVAGRRAMPAVGVRRVVLVLDGVLAVTELHDVPLRVQGIRE